MPPVAAEVTRTAEDPDTAVKELSELISREGALAVRVLAKAIERGAPGQRIRLENPTTRQRFEAEVIGPGAARLQLLPSVGAVP